MSATADHTADLLARIAEEDVRSVRLWFTDILGTLKSFSIDASRLGEAIEHGLVFDGSSITGFNPVEESDMLAVPDPSTFAVLPWGHEGERAARIICDVHTADGAPYEGDPRFVLRRALAGMHELGFDAFEVGPELEYYLFRGRSSTEPLDEGGYFDLTTLDAGSDVRRETVLALEHLGIGVDESHHEGGPSQHEVDLRARDALGAADACVTARIVVKEVALRRGWHATFMPKPLDGRNGSGMHLHQTLCSGGVNAFADLEDPSGLSDVGRAFIAGQLRHAREVCAVLAQWVNSYKRLVPGFEASVYCAWSRRNRSALARVAPPARGRARPARVELRAADPACNPYLAFAALLTAGLEGVRRGYELPEPMERNLYDLSPEDRARLGVARLPETLGEAIEVTADSELALRTLGEHAFSRFVEIKRREWEEYRVQVSQWELDRYLPIL